ncbi:MAG TPA: phenylacetaldoxime dehydratase family protein [Candidatus Binataceae bacterium]|nr:phenylacetaldoxime dehydratase family protein [Candidatus Binataceae bacterium]
MKTSLEISPAEKLPLAKGTPDDWKPPAPAWIARFATPSGQIVITYLATQIRGEATAQSHRALTAFLSGDCGPHKIDHGVFVDRVGHQNLLTVAYWNSPVRYERWFERSGFARWWHDPARLGDDAGYFREVLTIPTDRIETIFSTPEPAGAAVGHKIEGPILEHNYWGSMRDRMPIASTNHLVSSYGERLPSLGSSATLRRLLRVSVPENLAVVRSGQDWSGCEADELEIYQQSVRPALIKAMESLRDDPNQAACCDLRFVSETDGDQRVSRSFGYGLFLSLGDMERWAALHPNHLAIFKAFAGLVRKCEYKFKLRLWHEVCVLPGAGQVFEYINCDPQTGLLPYFPSEQIQ